ncbi:hypothetical protein HK096_007618 [Nowakowskiella sp. JEL0078]|nr:hypothetical protein HK096_007618 [Nowakowskiella sp. JEL0078]
MAFFSLIWSHTEMTAVINNILWYQQHIKETHSVKSSESENSEIEKRDTLLDDDLKSAPSEALLMLRFTFMVSFRVWVAPYFVWKCSTVGGGISYLFKELFISGKHNPTLAFLSILDPSVMALVNFAWTWASYKAWRKAVSKRVNKKSE